MPGCCRDAVHTHHESRLMVARTELEEENDIEDLMLLLPPCLFRSKHAERAKLDIVVTVVISGWDTVWCGVLENGP